MNLPDPYMVARPVVVVLLVVEMVYARFSGRGRFELRDTAASIVMGVGSTFFSILFVAAFTAAFAVAVHRYRVVDIGWSWVALGICLVLDDMAYYWMHRASHRVRWLWADRVPHHSSQHLNFTTGFRLSWSDVLTPGILFNVPMIVLGFPLEMLVFVRGVNQVYQFWVHTETIGKLPRWFEAVMNTPSHHRVHHATNARYLDSNYAGIFIVWDKLFGTFVEERKDDPPRYGIVNNLATFNVVRIAYHEWVAMFIDLRRARSLREVVGYVLGPPGWSPDASRDTTESIKARHAAYAARPIPAE